MLTITSREFNQNASRVKKAADNAPVFITDRGKVSHVLLSYEAYASLVSNASMADLLACPESADLDFQPARLTALAAPAEF